MCTGSAPEFLRWRSSLPKGHVKNTTRTRYTAATSRKGMYTFYVWERMISPPFERSRRAMKNDSSSVTSTLEMMI